VIQEIFDKKKGGQVMKAQEIHKEVRKKYAEVAKTESSCCVPSCCGESKPAGDPERATTLSRGMGYSDEELEQVPEGANLGLGCGNPVALASLEEGQTVLDLGSGGGFDSFLAAKQVGEEGRVIGVDMTPEMIDRAQHNAEKGGYENVEFRLGKIEHLPLADHSVDVVLSNCVINLSPDKEQVFQEAFRALKPGGRLMVSDIVLLKPLPRLIKVSIEAYVACLAGAATREDYLRAIQTAGFVDIEVVEETSVPVDLVINDPLTRKLVKGLNMASKSVREVIDSIRSVRVSAVKPRTS
jgi:SAM-dependent methyltransferase